MTAKHVSSSTLGTKPDTYLFTLTQIAATSFATIASDDSLRLFDVPSLKTTLAIPSCNKGVACVTTDADRQAVLTAGRDGLINAWDPRTGTPISHFREPKAAGIASISCQSHYVAAGTESTSEGLGEVRVLVFDQRQPGQPLRAYGDSHTDTITVLDWHPKQPSLLLSGSTDGLVSIFDVEQAEEEDAIQQVLNPRSAVHCSGFFHDDQAYVLTTDETFTVYSLDKTGTPEDEALPVLSLGDLRPELDCMYAIDLLKTHSQRTVIAHGHNEKQTLALTLLEEANGLTFGKSISFPSAHGEEVVRDIKLLDQDKLMLSCGEDGHVRLWTLPHEVMSSSVTNVSSGKSTSKKEKKEKRYAPY